MCKDRLVFEPFRPMKMFENPHRLLAQKRLNELLVPVSRNGHD